MFFFLFFLVFILFIYFFGGFLKSLVVRPNLLAFVRLLFCACFILFHGVIELRRVAANGGFLRTLVGGPDSLPSKMS